ncbi:MAG: hypothetical protein IJW21_07875 [Clostridia bacterium]|nr:hypothetical protein [Clostridia bacterium]
MGRVIFNEDPNHFIFDRARAGFTEISEKDCRDFIMQYAGTDITDFMICVNASIAWYDSVRVKNIIEQYEEWKSAGKSIPEFHGYIKLLTDFYKKHGKVPQDIWIDALREAGIRPWTSIRMNDIHESDAEDSVIFSDFYRENRHKNRASHRKAASYYENGLDYTYAEVRAHSLALIEDVLERFDTDGLELDWMREIYSVGIGREYEGIAVINSFMRAVKALVRRAEKARGHSISVAVRLPATPEKALRLGFDVFDWVENGLVNLITVTPRWSSTDNGMPIDLWKRTFAGKNVTIAAGLEILIDAYNRRGRKYKAHTYETAVASACANLWQGADATYLFNFMDTACAGREQSFCTGENGRSFLSAVGDLARCTAEKRRHIVTYSDVSAIGAESAKPLPARVSAGSFAAFRLVTGEIPAGREVNVVFGVAAGGDFASDEAEVYVSARKCIYAGERAPRAQQYADMRYFAYTVLNDGTLPPVSVIEAGGVECTLHWVEIEIN